MGSACGKWSEAAACVPTSEAGLRTRWCTVMDTAAALPFTKVTLAAASGALRLRGRQLLRGGCPAGGRRQAARGAARLDSARLRTFSPKDPVALSRSLALAVYVRARVGGWVGL